ncbi:MAG TPA: FKBP-type peptidyl-prolyl cis-trans isomerase [Planctomycetes bacterium]|nr:FKBP-type peptidyl-prolyl cis-trans isomerase [Fuerstiella sp.]HIK91694.1 FKBP-type peptidyl-prolyl cis-trans isomerase [Planctomycetota bacterium]
MHVSYSLLAIIFAASFAVAGCSGPQTKSGSSVAQADYAEGSDIQQASFSRGKATTFLDLKSLQYDCGPIDPDAAQEFQMTDSGLRYRILRKAHGRKPTGRNSVTVNYRGWLDSGKEFDSSYDRGEPISFPLNGVIPGWTEGMQLVGVGGMIELWVPARLGYGSKGSGGSVPPNATLHFIVELLKVE